MNYEECVTIFYKKTNGEIMMGLTGIHDLSLLHLKDGYVTEEYDYIYVNKDDFDFERLQEYKVVNKILSLNKERCR